MTDRKNNNRIFISYSSNDRRWADLLAKELIRHGLDVFYDQTSLVPGEDWRKAIEDALIGANTFIVLASPSARNSEWMNAELNSILSTSSEREITVIPVVVPDATFDDIPAGLRNRIGLD